MKYVVNGLVVLDEQILLVKNKHLEKSDNEYWSLPGGGVEDGESLRQALEREMLEETGVDPEVGELLFINEYRLEDGSYAGPNFIFNINNPEDFRNADFSTASHSFELSDIRFINIDETNNVRPPWLIDKIKTTDFKNIEYLSD